MEELYAPRCRSGGRVELQGKLKYQRPYAPHKVAYRLHKAGLSMDECILVEDLLLQMLQYDPSKRLTARECLSHTWFSFKND